MKKLLFILALFTFLCFTIQSEAAESRRYLYFSGTSDTLSVGTDTLYATNDASGKGKVVAVAEYFYINYSRTVVDSADTIAVAFQINTGQFWMTVHSFSVTGTSGFEWCIADTSYYTLPMSLAGGMLRVVINWTSTVSEVTNGRDTFKFDVVGVEDK